MLPQELKSLAQRGGNRVLSPGLQVPQLLVKPKKHEPIHPPRKTPRKGCKLPMACVLTNHV